jgi:uncharacterized protein
MPSIVRRLSAAMCALILVCASGCSSSPATRFYLLAPLPAETPRAVASGPAPVVGLRPVRLPEQLDRPQIVTRVGPNRLQLADFDLWAAPLSETFTRVLAEDLAILVPTDRVLVFPWPRESLVDYEVAVAVVRFEGALGGDCSLVADWTISRRDGKEAPKAARSSHSGPAGGSYTELVAAQSRLIGALGHDIAAALKAMPR